jgi:hypothetical protein
VHSACQQMLHKYQYDELALACACGFFSRRADTESKPAARDRFARMPVAPSPCLCMMTFKANVCSSPHNSDL